MDESRLLEKYIQNLMAVVPAVPARRCIEIDILEEASGTLGTAGPTGMHYSL